MKKNQHAWAVVADERQALLVEVNTTPGGTCRVKEHERCEEHWEPKEHHRPSPLSGKGGHDYAAFAHESEERIQRFAREVSVWVQQQVHKRHIDELAVFAPPKLLGCLRPAWPAQLDGHIKEYQANLAQRPMAGLADYEAIQRLVQKPQRGR